MMEAVAQMAEHLFEEWRIIAHARTWCHAPAHFVHHVFDSSAGGLIVPAVELHELRVQQCADMLHALFHCAWRLW